MLAGMARRKSTLGNFIAKFRDALPPRHARKKKTPHPYAVSMRAHAARKIESPITGRELFATTERDHHITTAGRLLLGAEQFALPPGPEERRRGIKGRLPIDTIKRARNALTRASQMHKHRHISAGQLAEVRRKVHAAWPSITSESHATIKGGWTQEHKPSGASVIERHVDGCRLTVVPVSWSNPRGPANWSVTCGRHSHADFDHQRGRSATVQGAKSAALRAVKAMHG